MTNKQITATIKVVAIKASKQKAEVSVITEIDTNKEFDVRILITSRIIYTLKSKLLTHSTIKNDKRIEYFCTKTSIECIDIKYSYDFLLETMKKSNNPSISTLQYDLADLINDSVLMLFNNHLYYKEYTEQYTVKEIKEKLLKETFEIENRNLCGA